MVEVADNKRARIVLGSLIALLVLLLIVLVVVFVRLLQPLGLPTTLPSTGKMEWVRSLYGFGPSADEQLLWPSSVAVAPDGDIYVTDQVRARIMVFRPDGTFRRLLHTGGGGTAEGQFIRPESISVSEGGDLYIADSQANKIIVFNSTGTYLREWPVDAAARGVYVDEGKVYVLDSGKVIIYNTNGTRRSSFSTRGKAPGQIDAYQGIVAKDGIVYVADAYNKRLQAFDETGRLQWVLPDATSPLSVTTTKSAGDGSGSQAVPGHKWDLPQDLTFDGRGRLIVVDAFQFEIAVVDPKTGKVQATYGEFGKEDGQFFYPTSIAYDSARDWFVVADTQNNRVQIVKIPNSSPSVSGPSWRALASPYRYLLVPALVLLVAIIFAIVTARRGPWATPVEDSVDLAEDDLPDDD